MLVLSLSFEMLARFCRNLVYKRHHLLSSSFEDLPCAHVPVTKGTIMDLLIFQKDEGLPLRKEWYDFVGLEISGLSDKQLRDRLKTTTTTTKSTDSPMTRCQSIFPDRTSPKKLRAFFFMLPGHFQLNNRREQLSQAPEESTIPPTAAASATCTSVASACLGRQMAALRRKVEYVQEELTVSKAEQDTLKEVARERAAGLEELKQISCQWKKKGNKLFLI